MKFTIKRSGWLRGEGLQENNEDRSRLLRESDGKRCCLGFFLNACGVEDRNILEKVRPDDVVIQAHLVPAWLRGPNADYFMLVNDSSEEEDREEKLYEMFANQGVEVTFED